MSKFPGKPHSEGSSKKLLANGVKSSSSDNNHNNIESILPKTITSNQIREYQEHADLAISLLLCNKINSKNAFDVNNSFLDQLPKIFRGKDEAFWQKISATLDASAKIFGYRVDSVHSDMFKFLGGLNRTDMKELEDGDDGLKKKKKNGDSNENVVDFVLCSRKLEVEQLRRISQSLT